MRKFTPSLLAAAISAAMLTASLPASAEEGTVGELVRLESETGVFQAETRVVYIDLPGDDEFGWNAALGYGLSDTLQLRAEIATSGTGFDRSVDAVIASVRWIILGQDGGPISFGIQPGLAIDTHNGNIGSETFIVLQGEAGAFDLIGNLLVGSEAGDWDAWGTSYAARAQTAISNRFTLGAEIAGTLSGDGKGAHFAGPTFALALGEDGPVLEGGLFAPLSSEAPDFQARIAIEAEF